MEVHHHPHIKEKNFKEYFFEFVMIFLAVTLGFIAENIREHEVEKAHAKELAKGFFNDLLNDSARIENSIRIGTIICNNLDELVAELNNPAAINRTSALSYFQASLMGDIVAPVPTETNLEQLKNSGSLRYFKDEKLVQMIGVWDQQITNGFKTRQNLDGEKLIEIIKSVNKVFIPEKISDESINIYVPGFVLTAAEKDSLKAISIPLLSKNREAINEFIGWAVDKRSTIEERIKGLYTESLERIHEMTAELKKEYHLK